MKFTVVFLMLCTFVSAEFNAGLYSCYLSDMNYKFLVALTSFSKADTDKEFASKLNRMVDKTQKSTEKVLKAYNECKEKLTDKFVNEEFAFCYVRALKSVCYEIIEVMKRPEFKGKV